MADKIYDICCIGAGVAGMTAAIYGARAEKSILLLDKNGFGGQIASSPKVENIPGFTDISGIDFATKVYEQVSGYPNIDIIDIEAKFLNYNHGLIIVQCENEINYYCKSLIIATGAEPKKLDLNTPNIYYCATCDGPLFKNKSVIVVGAGNTGATFAVSLATYCKEVFIIDTTLNMTCEAELQKQLKSTSNIYWLPNCTINSVTSTTKGKLSAVTLSTGETLKCSAIFAAIGMIPHTDFAASMVERDSLNYIVANENCKTSNVPGIFVAGDCRTKAIRQVTTAMSDGTVAALAALKYLRETNI